MSLNRVQSIEVWERPSRDASPAAALEHRKMSFNPTDLSVLPVLPGLDQKPVSAIEVSETRRFVQIVLACIYCLLAAGIVFGYAAFKPVLVKEGVYQGLCPPSDPGSRLKTCTPQEIRLNLMFTTAAVVTNVVALPVGTILDKYGPRVSGFIGAFFLALGASFFIMSPHVSFDAYLPGYVFLALGGPFVYISSFQLSNCFPRHSGLILALLTGSFDTSSAVLLIYRLIYNATGESFTPSRFFTVYLIVPVFIVLVQAFVMPANSYKTIGEIIKEGEHVDESEIPRQNITEAQREALIEEQRKARRESVLSEITPLLDRDDQDKVAREEERKKKVSGVWGALHGMSAFQQIKTPWWFLIALFTTFQMTRINYFVATIRAQYDYLLGSYQLAVRVNDFFDIALPAGGVVAVPFIGMILDNLSTPATLALLVVVATAIGILGVISSIAAAYANIILFVLYRPFYYTAVSDYTAKVFGFHTFGKVYGLVICIAGLFNFSQSGLDALTHRIYNNDPRPANIILLAVVFVIGSSMVAYVQSQKRRMARIYLEEEAEDASERLMPDPTLGNGGVDDPEARRGREQVARQTNGSAYGTT